MSQTRAKDERSFSLGTLFKKGVAYKLIESLFHLQVHLACWELQVYFRHPLVDHQECLPLLLPQGQERTLLDSQGCLEPRELQGLEPHRLACHQACRRPLASLPQGLRDLHPEWADHLLFLEPGLLGSTGLQLSSRELEPLLPTPLAPLQVWSPVTTNQIFLWLLLHW